VPDKTPSEHEYVPLPVRAYPVLHEGMHELPLARLDVHVPNAPFAGAVIVHGLALQTAVSVRPAPSLLQYRLPESVYPVLHVGEQNELLTSADVHGLGWPFVIAPAALHGLPQQYS
jgi:hypothetical protein